MSFGSSHINLSLIVELFVGLFSSVYVLHNASKLFKSLISFQFRTNSRSLLLTSFIVVDGWKHTRRLRRAEVQQSLNWEIW